MREERQSIEFESLGTGDEILVRTASGSTYRFRCTEADGKCMHGELTGTGFRFRLPRPAIAVGGVAEELQIGCLTVGDRWRLFVAAVAGRDGYDQVTTSPVVGLWVRAPVAA